MIVPLALKILGSVSAVALAGTVTLIAIPLLNPAPPDAWLDAPHAGAILAEGDVLLSMHTNVPGATSLRVVLHQDGAADIVLTDTTPETTARGADAIPLTLGVVQWPATVGEYDALVQTCSPGRCWADGGTAHLTIVTQDPPFAEMPEDAAGVDEGIPTDEPTEEPEEPGEEEPEPEPDPEPEPSDAVPSGRISQDFRDGAQTATTFTVTRITPSTSEVTVLVQVVPAGSGYDDSSWQALGCETFSGSSCTTNEFDAGTNGGANRWGYYQLVLVNGSETYYGDVEYWELLR